VLDLSSGARIVRIVVRLRDSIVRHSGGAPINRGTRPHIKG
jgi:hypothetical protein